MRGVRVSVSASACVAVRFVAALSRLCHFRLWYRRRALGEVLSETVLQDSLAWSVCGIYTIYIYLGFRVVFKGIWCLLRVIKGYGRDM